MDYSLLGEDIIADPFTHEFANRDEKFYREDGDTVILVENTLFKIHRSLLTAREPSSFRDMFSFPRSQDPRAAREGDDDTHPITLHDTTEEFRILCLVLYALPSDHEQIMHSLTIPSLGCLASIADKYCLRSLLKWSWRLLVMRCTDTEPEYLSVCPEGLLEKLVDLSVQVGEPIVRSAVENHWLSRLEAEPRTASVPHALNVGERLSMRYFLGRAYYVVMLEACKASADSDLQDYESFPTEP